MIEPHLRIAPPALAIFSSSLRVTFSASAAWRKSARAARTSGWGPATRRTPSSAQMELAIYERSVHPCRLMW